jgi:hypothetical protein
MNASVTTIPFESVIKQIERATALFVDETSLVFPQIYAEGEEYDDALLSFETAYGEERFTVADNMEPKLIDGAIHLMNTDGNEAKIYLLGCMNWTV